MDKILNPIFERLFFGILNPIFAPMNAFLAKFYQPSATIFALAMVIGAMLWIGLILNARYVYRGNPYKNVWSDLRLWTVISMLPHVLVYLYFR